jgi:hypothetical protein
MDFAKTTGTQVTVLGETSMLRVGGADDPPGTRARKWSDREEKESQQLLRCLIFSTAVAKLRQPSNGLYGNGIAGLDSA